MSVELRSGPRLSGRKSLVVVFLGQRSTFIRIRVFLRIRNTMSFLECCTACSRQMSISAPGPVSTLILTVFTARVCWRLQNTCFWTVRLQKSSGVGRPPCFANCLGIPVLFLPFGLCGGLSHGIPEAGRLLS